MTDHRATVLVVDDEESMRYFVTKTLRREGYEVVVADDGPSALAAVQSCSPDIALLDVRMPGMDGVALMRALRTTFPGLPIVLMTGYGSVESALHAMKQGATDYVSKPFRVDALRTTVARALDRSSRPVAPKTIREAVPAELVEPVATPDGPLPTPAPPSSPAPTAEIPERGVVEFLRERAEDRRLPLDWMPPGGVGLKSLTRLCELVYVDELLRLTDGNISRSAELAGITRPNLHRKVQDLGLQADHYRYRPENLGEHHA